MWAQARLRKSADDLSILERITRAATQARFTDSERGMALWHLGLAHLRRGHAARAVEILRESVALTGEDLQGAALSALAPARDVGIVADTAALRWLLELEARVGPRFYTLSVAAIRDGRVRLADQLVRQLEARADSALASGDSLGSRWLRGEAETVSGRIAAARDSLDVAIERVRHGLSLINATWNLDLDRYWLAHAIKDRGGEPEAIAIFGSVYWTAWAEALGYLHRAQLHERRGETAESARYYARFIRLWRDADPHLQPQVEAARRALERLRGEPQPS
jgi:tetratricopeptide (TPR) repeat protein